MKKLLFLFITIVFVSNAEAQFAEGIMTSVAIDKVKSGLNDLVSESLDRADYSVAKASIQALGIIDAWEEANSNLLEKAFDRLDNTSKNMFSNMFSLINEVDAKISSNLEKAQRITENANQISESIIGSEKRTFILRYTPMIINPSKKDSVLVRLRGVNLDKSKPIITLPNNTVTIAKIIGPQEINFWLPLSSLTRSSNSSSINEIKIKHTTRDGSNFIFFPKYKEVERIIMVSTLPEEVGTYSLTGKRKFETEERKIHTVDMGKFKATNRTINKVANPPSGYDWDLRLGIDSHKNFSIVSTGGGEKGRCQEIVWNGSNKHGIIGSARLDQIRQIRNFEVRWKDGYKSCGIKGPIYRMIPSISDIESVSGKINWNKDEIVNLPEGTSEFNLTIKLYNGKTKVITNTFSDGIISVTKDSNRLIIRTKIPSDIITE